MDTGAEVEKRNLCRWRPKLEGGYHRPRNTKETTKTETGDGRPAVASLLKVPRGNQPCWLTPGFHIFSLSNHNKYISTVLNRPACEAFRRALGNYQCQKEKSWSCIYGSTWARELACVRNNGPHSIIWVLETQTSHREAVHLQSCEAGLQPRGKAEVASVWIWYKIVGFVFLWVHFSTPKFLIGWVLQGGTTFLVSSIVPSLDSPLIVSRHKALSVPPGTWDPSFSGTWTQSHSRLPEDCLL